MKRAKAEKADRVETMRVFAKRVNEVLPRPVDAQKQGKSSSTVMNLYLAIEQQDSDGTYLKTLLARGFDLEEGDVPILVSIIDGYITHWVEEPPIAEMIADFEKQDKERKEASE